MAIEDNLDELYALNVASVILCMRMWSYVTTAAAKAGGTTEREFIERQRKMSIESADLCNFVGHRDPDQLKQQVIAQINTAWNGIIMVGPSGSRLQ
jgi:hypothetical protein